MRRKRTTWLLAVILVVLMFMAQSFVPVGWLVGTGPAWLNPARGWAGSPASLPVTFSRVVTFILDAPGTMPEPWDGQLQVVYPPGVNSERVTVYYKVGSLPYSFRFPVKVTVSYDLSQAYPGNTFPVSVTITPPAEADGAKARIRSLYGLNFGLKKEVQVPFTNYWLTAFDTLGFDFCINVDESGGTPFAGAELAATDSVDFLNLLDLLEMVAGAAAGSGSSADGSTSSGGGGSNAAVEIGKLFLPNFKLNLTGGLKVQGQCVSGRILATGACSMVDQSFQWWGSGDSNTKTVSVTIPQNATPGSLIHLTVAEMEYHFDVWKGMGCQLDLVGIEVGSPLAWTSAGTNWVAAEFTPTDADGLRRIEVPIPVQSSPWDLAISDVFLTDQATGRSYHLGQEEFFELSAGRPVQFGLKVNNLGWNSLVHLATDTRAVAALYVDGENLGSVRVADTGGFLTGAEQTVTSAAWTFSPAPGTHLVTVKLDPDGSLHDGVPSNNVVSLQFVVPQYKGSLEGFIYRAGGDISSEVPLAQIERVALANGREQYVGEVFSDTEGDTCYRFRDIPATTWSSAGGVEDLPYHLVISTAASAGYADKSVTVTLPRNSTAYLNVALDPTAVLRGVVKDNAGSPLPNASVSVNSTLTYTDPVTGQVFTTAVTEETFTDSNGNYLIGKLSPGTYNVKVSHPACYPYPADPATPVSLTLTTGENVRDFTLTGYYDNLRLHLNGDASRTVSTSLTVTFTGRPPDTWPVAVRLAESQGALNSATERPYPVTDCLIYTLTDTAEGQKTVYAQFKNPDGFWSSPVSASITYDATGPTGTVAVVDPDSDGETDNSQGALALDATDAGGASLVSAVELSNDGVNWRRVAVPSPAVHIQTEVPWTLAGSGQCTVHARYVDEWGNIGPEITATITVTYPNAVLINGGAAYTGSTTVSCSFIPGETATEQGSANSGAFFGGTDVAHKVAQPFSLTQTANVAGVALALGRTSACVVPVTLSIYQPAPDGQPPAAGQTPLASATVAAADVSLAPDPSAVYTKALFSAPVNLTAGSYYLVVDTTPSADNHYLLWADAIGYVPNVGAREYDDAIEAWVDSYAWENLAYKILVAPPRLRLCTDGTFDTEAWENYAPQKTVALPGTGLRSVGVQFGDAVPNVTSEVWADIFVDTTAPTVDLSVRGYAPGTYFSTRGLTLDLTAGDEPGGSGIQAVRLGVSGPGVNDAGTWEPFQAVQEVTLPGDGSFLLTFEARDRAGNTAITSGTVLVDTVGPVVDSFTINAGKQYTNKPVVSVAWTASDAGSGLKDVRLSSGAAFTDWLPLTGQAALTWTWWVLPAWEGVHTIRAQFRDNAGHVTEVNDSIILSYSRPYPVPQPTWSGFPWGGFATALPVTAVWGASQDATGIASYHVQVAENDPTFSPSSLRLDTYAAGTLSPLQQALGDAVLRDQHTYYLRVEAVNGAGTASGWAQAYWPLRVDLSPPAAPTITSSTHPRQDVAYPGTQAVLSWTPALHISGTVGYSLVLDQSNDTIPDEAVDTTDTSVTYEDVAPGRYYLHVRALDGAGHWSATAHYCLVVDPSAPYPPTDLAVTAGDAQVTLTWTASSTPGVGYNVYRATASGAYEATPVNPTPVAGTTYTDLGLVNGTTYYYVVKALDELGNLSQASGEVSATPQGQLPAPVLTALTLVGTPPTLTVGETFDLRGLTLTATDQYGEPYDLAGKPVTWASGDTGVAAVSGSLLVAMGAGTTAVTATVEGVTSNALAFSVVAGPVAPNPPTGLQATAGDAQVTLTWTASSTPGVGYNVYRATASGAYGATPVNPTPVAGTTYTDTGLVNGTTYYYVVKARDASGYLSEASNEAVATPQAQSGGGSGGGGGAGGTEPPPQPSVAGVILTGTVDAGTGGTVQSDDGTVTLDIPGGAIPVEPGTLLHVAIGEVAPVEVAELLKMVTVPEGVTLVGRAFTFEAETVLGGERTPVTFFDVPLTFGMEFDADDLAEVTDPAKVGLFRLNDDGSLTFVGGKLVEGRLVVQMWRFSRYVLAEVNITFGDVQSHWARKDIELMAAKYVVKGLPGGDFAPEGRVTRVQFAIMLLRAMGLPEAQVTGLGTVSSSESTPGPVPADGGTVSFRDVATTDWYYAELCAAVRAGLVKGYADGTFRPNDPVTREQAAAMVGRALLASGKATGLGVAEVGDLLLGFSDQGAVSSWARGDIALALKEGIIRGRTATTIAPQAGATRAEATVMVARFWQME